MNDFKKLTIWKKGMNLCVKSYELTSSFPTHEMYGLVSQIRRSAISIPSNIAEGAGRSNPKEFRQFLNIAYGSLCELQTQWMIARKLNFVTKSDYSEINTNVEEILKMIYVFQKKLDVRINNKKSSDNLPLQEQSIS